MKGKKSAGADQQEKVIVVERVAALKKRLLELYTPEDADQWLQSPQKLLDGMCPIDMLWSINGYMAVDNVIDALMDSAFL